MIDYKEEEFDVDLDYDNPEELENDNYEEEESYHGKARLSESKVIEALNRGMGNISFAANILKRSHNEVRDFINKRPKLLQLKKNLDEQVIDVAEMLIYSKMQKGDINAIKFVLEKKGRNRGWGKDDIDENKLNKDEETLDIVNIGNSSFTI